MKPISSVSLLNFLAGVASGAGANLLTSIPAGKAVGLEATLLVACSLPWCAVAIALAHAGATIENALAAAERAARGLSTEELDGFRSQALADASGKLWRLQLLAAMGVIIGGWALTFVYQ